LSIEEQFYMVLPAAALAAAALGWKQRWAWIAVGLAFGAGMLARADAWLGAVQGHEYWMHNYFKYIYYSSSCRFDELLAGVALALLKNRQPQLWQRLAANGNALAAGGVAVTALACWLFLHDHFGFAVTVFGYPLIAFGFSMLIVAAVGENSLLRTLRVPGASSLALWSYAVYLTHKQVCVMLAQQLRAHGIDVEAPLAVVGMLLASLLAGWLLYRLVETPFMALRARYVPSNAPQLAVSA
jgi:peptidoglycan/LPS O-acetylase OafA/YrhL